MSDTFPGLPPELQKTLNSRGYSELTSVQKAVVDSQSLDGDLRISSQTGSGKTVAVGIAIARALLAAGPREGKPFGRPPTVLLLTPTRELAAQVQRELEWLLAEVPDATVDVVTGGTSVGLERKRLGQGPRVLVGTPGRLLDHLGGKAFDPSRIDTVVLDEADQMLDMGFRDELEGILEQLPSERRTHLVSATFSGDVDRIAKKFQSNPVMIEGSPRGQANTDIEHIAYIVEMRHRYDALVNVLLLAQAERSEGDPGRTLVFTRTRVDTIEVAERLQKDGIRAEPMSGDLAQAQRTRTLKAFRSGQVDTIVATDVAARGLDVQGVDLVIHLDPPMDSDTFTHRSGRTGRAGRKGTSVLILPPQARRRMERILGEARVKPVFQPVPSAQKIHKAYQKLGRRKIYAALTPLEEGAEGAEIRAEQLEFAAKLLVDREPAAVIAALISLLELAPPCTPRDVTAPFEHHGGPRDRDRERPRPVQRSGPFRKTGGPPQEGGGYAPRAERRAPGMGRPPEGVGGWERGAGFDAGSYDRRPRAESGPAPGRRFEPRAEGGWAPRGDAGSRAPVGSGEPRAFGRGPVGDRPPAGKAPFRPKKFR